MTSERQRLIERIHAAPWRGVIVVTGGGASAIGELLTVPGGSRTVLEGVVPYSAAALRDWLGRKPEHFCSEETALAMATVAYRRAGELASREMELEDGAGKKSGFSKNLGFAEDCVGVACTASLVSDRPKKGAHRCHVAAHSERRTIAWSLMLEKGARDRSAEESVVGGLILQALGQAAGLADLPALDLRAGEAVVEQCAEGDRVIIELLDGVRRVAWSLPDGRVVADHKRPRGILCGAFNPLHHGHRQLRDVAEQLLGGPVGYEISIRNVDKPPLDFLTIDRRRAQFTEQPLALTVAPTFAEKADALPGVTFVVGVDTAERIVQPKYYGDSAEKTTAALRKIRERGCRFLVAGRVEEGKFRTLRDISVPAEFADLFSEIPAEAFRVDVSSTELRRVAHGEGE